MRPRDIDLNLLAVFVQLYEDRKVSLAADNLGVSQPTVSNALARLRRLLDDELFVRTARGMQPTPRADALAAPISATLAQLRETLARQLSFEPARSSRQFTLAMTDIGETFFLPPLMRTLAAVAPGVGLNTVRGTALNLHRAMEAGEVDLALGYLPDLVADFRRRILFAQHYVCLFRRDHPAASQGLDQAAFARAQHAVVIAAGTGHDRVLDHLRQAGVALDVRLRVPHFVALADVLESSDLVATVPEVFARRSVRHFALASCPHPVALPPIDIGLFWHAKSHRDPASRWLRETIVAAVREAVR